MITLRTLGECVIEIGGEAFTPEADALFAAVLYLAHERGKRVPRDRLAELIWPTLPIGRARHCLRQIVYRMRMLGVPVDAGRESISLAESTVNATFSAAPTPATLAAERAAGTLRLGPYLPGYQPKHSQPFAEWADGVRSETEARVRRALLELAQVHRLRGEWSDVETLARECVRLDPLNEEANLAIAECAAMVGGKSEALAILDRYIHDLGPSGSALRLPATVLRRRIAERFPVRRYRVPTDRCFVGRAHLMEILATGLLRARNSEGSAVLLQGVPGIGKSRLTQELASIAVMQGVRTVRVGCDETDAQRPMSVWVDAVQTLRELPGALGVSPDSVRFLKRLTEIDPPEDGLTESLRDPRWIASRIRQSLVDLVDSISSEATLLLVIEDVHWLDAASWAAVTAMLEGMAQRRMLLVLTSRGPHPTEATPARCAEQIQSIDVGPLTEHAATELCKAIVAHHGGSCDSESLAWCTTMGEGNPLLLRELVVHCLEGSGPKEVPPSLRPLIAARIARLSETAKRVAEAIAVLGTSADLPRLERMLDLAAHQLASAISELSAASLLTENQESVGLRHAVIRSLVTDQIAPPTLRYLHRRAAVALELDARENPSAEIAWALLFHAREAGDQTRYHSLVLTAARRHLLLGSPRDAADLVERSLAILSTGAFYREALRLQIEIHGAMGQWNAARAKALRLTATAASDPSDPESATDNVRLFEAALRSGAPVTDALASALAIARNSLFRSRDRIRAARYGVTSAAVSGSIADQAAFLQAIQDLRSDPTVHQAPLDELELIAAANIGDFSVARGIAMRVRQQCIELAGGLERLSLLVSVADAFRLADDREIALETANAGLKYACQLGSEHFEAAFLARRLTVSLELGMVDVARVGYPRLRELVSTNDQTNLGGTADAIGARIALLDGDYSRAITLATDCLTSSLHVSGSMAAHRRIAVTLAAEVALKTSRDPLPDPLLRELRSVHETLQDNGLHDRTAAVLHAALARAGHARDAESMLGEYLREHRRASASWEENSTLLRVRPADFLHDR